MNFLVDCYHPANYLILRQAMKKLSQQGHEVTWCIRSKDVLADLMDFDGINYEVLTRPLPGLWGRVKELAIHDLKVLRRVLSKKIDFAIGASVSVAHAAYLVPSCRSIVFNDDDADVVKQFVQLGYRFADWVVTPDCLNEDHGPKHRAHPSYHTLAYLHPDHFKPDPTVLDELGIKPGEKVFVLRFVSLNAFHDDHAEGMSFQDKLQIIARLRCHGRIFISCEGETPKELEPYRFHLPPGKLHSLLSYAHLLVSDSQTMTSEAAVLGVPSLRCNSFVGRIAYLDELEKRYGLTYGFRPQQIDELFAKLDEWLADPHLAASWQEKRQRMLAEKVNLADWIYNFITDVALQGAGQASKALPSLS